MRTPFTARKRVVIGWSSDAMVAVSFEIVSPLSVGHVSGMKKKWLIFWMSRLVSGLKAKTKPDVGQWWPVVLPKNIYFQWST